LIATWNATAAMLAISPYKQVPDDQPGFFVQTMKVRSEIGHLGKSNFVPLFNTIVKRKQHGNEQRN
jgi:hypothetical protein